MPSLGSAVYDIIVRAKADTKAFDTASKKLKNVSDKMSKVGKGMTKWVTAPVIGMGAAIIKTTLDFDTGMNKVEALAKQGGKSFDELSEQAKMLGSTTQFSAGQAADAMGFLAQAGFDTTEIFKSMPGVLSLAAASQLDIATTADIATNIMAGFGLASEDMGHAADVLALTTARTNTDLTQLGDAMKMIAPMANSLGVSLEETASVTGQLGNFGLKGTAATTALGTSLSRLSKPTDEVTAGLAAAGAEAFNANGEFVGMTELVRQVGTGTKDMTDKQRLSTIAMIFGARAQKNWLSLIEAGPEELDKLTEEMRNSEGAADDMAATMMQGLPGAMLNLKSASEGLMLAIGESGLIEAFTGVVDKVTEFFRGLTDANPLLLTFGTIAAGLAAVVGPSLILVGSMIKNLETSIGFAKKAWGKFSDAMNTKTGKVVGSIGLITFAILEIKDGWDKAVEGHKAFNEALENGTSQDVIDNIEERVGLMADKWWSPSGPIQAVSLMLDLFGQFDDALKNPFESPFMMGLNHAIITQYNLAVPLYNILSKIIKIISFGVLDLGVKEKTESVFSKLQERKRLSSGSAPPADSFTNAAIGPTGLPKAHGGPVAPGRSFLVGEQGPETFTPSSQGTISPNGAGGGTTIYITQTNVINKPTDMTAAFRELGYRLATGA